MSKTVIVCNPMGTDVTPLLSTLLRGTIVADGDTVYTLPYTNQPGITNIARGVDLLHAKLTGTPGPILVFGYSEGAQVVDKWLTEHGPSTPVDPDAVSFLLIGNANRKYGGFVHGHSEFDQVAYTKGRPDDTAYSVTDFARQYDGVADFPTAQPIQDAIAAIGTLTTDARMWPDALAKVANLIDDDEHLWRAATNAVVGMTLVHDVYFDVTADLPGNLVVTEGNTDYVWAPTYPVPLLGIGATNPRDDRRLRIGIESCFSRPVDIPLPDYPNTSWLNVKVPWQKPAVTGWWAAETTTPEPPAPKPPVRNSLHPGAFVAVTGSTGDGQLPVSITHNDPDSATKRLMIAMTTTRFAPKGAGWFPGRAVSYGGQPMSYAAGVRFLNSSGAEVACLDLWYLFDPQPGDQTATFTPTQDAMEFTSSGIALVSYRQCSTANWWYGQVSPDQATSTMSTPAQPVTETQQFGGAFLMCDDVGGIGQNGGSSRPGATTILSATDTADAAIIYGEVVGFADGRAVSAIARGKAGSIGGSWAIVWDGETPAAQSRSPLAQAESVPGRHGGPNTGAVLTVAPSGVGAEHPLAVGDDVPVAWVLDAAHSRPGAG